MSKDNHIGEEISAYVKAQVPGKFQEAMDETFNAEMGGLAHMLPAPGSTSGKSVMRSSLTPYSAAISGASDA